MSKIKVAAVIPARMASTRYPGKPIAKILGYPMIEHVYLRLKTSKEITEIVVATCDAAIQEVAQKFGAKVIMTSDKHTRGTDRVAEAAKALDADMIINVQGDEPLVDPDSIDEGVRRMKADPAIECINLISVIKDWDIFISRDVVKTAADPKGRVLYFSRQPIPSQKPETFKSALKQIGIYLFWKKFLLQFSSWPETPLEKAEAVDMMRILEHGHVIETQMSQDMISVDTPEDLRYAEGVIQNDLLYQRIFLKG
jgi:3-deoxy-manno-octulosonate cytidylyltransferase (CMP-KDO synthetase)